MSKEKKKKLAIVGLGNPGIEYNGTRHNIGFLIIDRIIETYKLGNHISKFDGEFWNVNHDEMPCFLLKPMTYMNNSGEAVQKMMRYYKLNPEDIIVIHDEIDLALGRIKVKKGGGSAGHNGLKSIDQHIGNDYWRIRFGVGRPNNDILVSNYVLGRFLNQDMEALVTNVEKIVDNFNEILRHNFQLIC